MAVSAATAPWTGTSGILSRGGLTGGAVGLTIGGVAGTAQWPVVGTFFGAVAGAVAGVIAGSFSGVALSVAVRGRPPPMTQRVIGAVTAALVIAVAHLVRVWPESAQTGWSALMAVVLIVVIGLASPMIVGGLPDARFRGSRLADALAWTVAIGTGIGGGLGALVGFGIGLTHLPTVLAAIVEAGVLGSVSGCVLALLVCAGIVAKVSVARTRMAGR